MPIHLHTTISAALAWLLAAALLAGCRGELHPLEIHLDFRAPRDGSAWTCPGLCASIPMACDGRLSIRVVHVEDPMRVHESECVPVPATAAGNLCALGNIDIPLGELPPGMARIEIAMWDAAQLPDQQCPPQPLFDLQGRPLPTVSPQPAIAGATYFDIGSARDVYVPMSCFELAPLARLECLPPPPPPTLVVEMHDLERNRKLGPGDGVESLIVESALLALTTDGDWVTTTDGIRPLDLAQLGDVARWQGKLDNPLSAGQELCVQVSDNTLSDPIPVLTCFDIDPADAADGQLRLDALYIPRSVVDIVFQTSGLASVPETGMVIGRVAPASGSISVAGLTVRATETMGAPDPGQTHGVVYPSEDWATIAGVTTTTSHGYFLATDVAYPSRWQASDLEGPRGGVSPYRGGLIQNVINAVRIPVGEAP